jgi:hypothetical protein
MEPIARWAVAILALARPRGARPSVCFQAVAPPFSPRFFTAELAAKYATPDAAFASFDTALINHDAALYEEVLGRPMTPDEERGFKTASFPPAPSRVVRRETRKDIVFLATDGNAGEFFEFVGGRWVFRPEDLGANLRLFFRSFGL